MRCRSSASAVTSPSARRAQAGTRRRPSAALDLGPDLFAADVLLLNGLDDRRQSPGVLDEAEN
jgi:hypothetical protein